MTFYLVTMTSFETRVFPNRNPGSGFPGKTRVSGTRVRVLDSLVIVCGLGPIGCDDFAMMDTQTFASEIFLMGVLKDSAKTDICWSNISQLVLPCQV